MVPNGYNLREGGGAKGRMSLESKKRLSESLKGKIISEEQRKKLSLARIGKKLSQEHKDKIGKASLGSKRSSETRIKMSKAQMGKKLSKETGVHNFPKKIFCVTTGEFFDSIKEASKKYGILRTSISNHINGLTKTAGKKVFNFVSQGVQ